MKAASSPLNSPPTAETKLRFGLKSTTAATVFVTASVTAYLAPRVAGCLVGFIPHGACIARRTTPLHVL